MVGDQHLSLQFCQIPKNVIEMRDFISGLDGVVRPYVTYRIAELAQNFV